jgi:hypothetical protein
VSCPPADREPSPAGDPALSGDRAITRERRETKYLMPRASYVALCQVLDRQLTAHSFKGDGANRLPGPQHFVTTIYFDTADKTQWRNAASDLQNNIKVRAKEYYDEHPGLAELATSADGLVAYKPWLWFELKRRAGHRTEKFRFRVSKPEAPRFFESVFSAQPIDGVVSKADDRELASIIAHCRAIGEPLSASCLVNYRRLAWQNEHSTLRVTLDLDVAFYAPPVDLWTRTRALSRTTLGVPRGIESSVVLEVKAREGMPAWLEQALTLAGARETVFSKFVRAGRAVHGDG